MERKRVEKLISRWSLLVTPLVIMLWLDPHYAVPGFILGILLSISEIKIRNKQGATCRITRSQVANWLLAK